MPKSVHTDPYRTFLRVLRQTREDSAVRQEDVAKALKTTQSIVSKIESGERRLDVIELRTFCNAIGVDFLEFMQRLDQALKDRQRARTKPRTSGY